jgi:spore coat protein A
MGNDNVGQERRDGRRTTRRAVLKAGGALGVASMLSVGAQRVRAAGSPSLEKYADPLPIPEVREPDGTMQGADYYHITLEQFTQKLHSDLPETPLWGYDGLYPGKTIEVRRNEPIKVRFDNSPLSDVDGHLLGEVDDRVHGTKVTDYEWPGGAPDPFPEIRTVTHAHGLHVEPESDGYPEAWESPDGVKGPFWEKAVYDYTNRQPAATLWYHDHALGITRLNVYAGLAGFYLIRDAQEERLNLPSGDYEVPILIQDRTFKNDGSGDLYYPKEFMPEFAGDTSVVNGKVWPYLEVEPRKYRFRFLNGSNGRTFSLRLEQNENGASETSVLSMHQVGVDLGFLPNTVTIPNADQEYLVLAPAERGDVIVDFSGHAGETFTLMNYAEMPYAGENSGSVDTEDFPGLPDIMEFRVGTTVTEADTSPDPTTLDLPSGPEFRARAARQTRYHTLDTGAHDGLDTHFLNDSLWDTGTVVQPQLGTTEIWWLANTTGDTHPIHLHLVEFQVHEIREFDSGADEGPEYDGFVQARERGESPAVEDYLGDPKPIPDNYRGDKDTVRVDPNEAVAIITQFGTFSGRYVWHCHILEHEDQEMMLPYEVVRGNRA